MTSNWPTLTTADSSGNGHRKPGEPGHHKIPKSDLVSSLAGRGPIPWWKITTVLALVREQDRIGNQRSPDSRSNMERFQETRGAASGEDKIRSAQRSVNKMIEEAERLKADRADLLADAERMETEHLIGPHGELLTTEDAAGRQDQLAAEVRGDVDQGSLKHRRVPRGLRRGATAAALIDLPVIAYFLSSVLNLDLTNPMGQPIQMAVTLVLALLATAGVALALRKFGRALRAHKDDQGHLRLPKGARVIPVLYLILCGAILVGGATVMAFRITSDAAASGVPPAAGWTLAVFFAIITCTINVVVISVEFADGSPTTEQLDDLAAKLLKVRARQQAARRRAERLGEQIEKLQQRGDRLIQRVLSDAGDGLGAAHQAILIARSYHLGCGTVADISQPGNATRQPPGYLNPSKIIDTQPLEIAAQHLASTTTP